MYNFASTLLNDKLHENTYNILVGVGPKKIGPQEKSLLYTQF